MRTIKISKDNEGREIKIRGGKQIIGKVLVSKEKFRVKQGEGEPVIDYKFEDIEEATGLVIDIIR